MRKTRYFLLLFLFIGSVYSIQANEIGTTVDKLFTGLVQDNLISGSVLIARDGQILVSKGYGPANREWNIPNRPETKFRLGSVTKQFTAMGILILANQGKLKLDDTLDKFLPQFPNADKIKIHHLLNHTSGVQSYNRVKDYGQRLIREMSIQEVIDWFKEEPPVGEPGEKFVYSNSGYVLLAAIIEKISGKSYEEFLKANIFKPLGMFATGQDVFERILPNRAHGYTIYEGKLYQAPYRNMPFTSGAGSMYSTVQDLYKWVQAVINGKLISPELKTKMFTPGKRNYGYGWFIRDAFQRKLVEHAGAINGFGAQVQIFEADKVVVIALYNFESTFQREMDRALAAIALGEKHQPVYYPQGKQVDLTVFKKACGEFAFHGKNRFTISEKGEGIIAKFEDGSVYKCLPQSEDSFFIKKRNLLFTMETNDKGIVDQFRVRMGLHRFMATRAK